MLKLNDDKTYLRILTISQTRRRADINLNIVISTKNSSGLNIFRIPRKIFLRLSQPESVPSLAR